MNCEKILCIYQDSGKCTCELPNIDSLGMCENCIIVDIPKKELKKYKDRDLKNLTTIGKTDKQNTEPKKPDLKRSGFYSYSSVTANSDSTASVNSATASSS